MLARDCTNCGKPAEPPFAIVRLALPPELVSEAESVGISIDWDFVFCIDCLDEFYEEEATERRLEQDVRSGSRCYLCCEPLHPPGSTAVRFGGTLRRVCSSCKGLVERWGQL